MGLPRPVAAPPIRFHGMQTFSTARRTSLFALPALALAACTRERAAQDAQPAQLVVASFPDLDRAATAAVPQWRRLHDGIAPKVVSLQYADHHTKMALVLATGSGVPDVMAVDFRFIGKFAEAGGVLNKRSNIIAMAMRTSDNALEIDHN